MGVSLDVFRVAGCGAVADADRVLAVYCGSSLPACSRTMYSAYQSGQFGSAFPILGLCCPCAADVRRSALAKSFADAKVVVALSSDRAAAS